MPRVYFATTNEGKLAEAREILGMEVVGTPLEIDEIQSLDPVEVAVKKARTYFQRLKKPIFVEDGSLFFESLNKLPGVYIDSFSKSLGNDGLAKLAGGSRAVAQVTVVYIDKKDVENVFIGKVKGKIANRPRGEKGFGWDPIFIPEGSRKTFAEMEMAEKNKYSMRKKALLKFKRWLKTATI